MTTKWVQLTPPQRPPVGDYDLDHIGVRLGEDETELDFRLELGQGVGFYWGEPAARNDRLRLWHVDGAAYYVPEHELIEDPWTCDLALTMYGDLGRLGNGRTLVEIRITVTSTPPSYACEFVTRRAGVEEQVTRLSWRA